MPLFSRSQLWVEDITKRETKHKNIQLYIYTHIKSAYSHGYETQPNLLNKKGGLLLLNTGTTLITCVWRSKVGNRDVKKVTQALCLVQIIDVVVVAGRW